MSRAWLLTGLLSATVTASYLCRVNVSVVGVVLMPEFGLTQAMMGRVFSAFLLGYALCQVPAGLLADRFGAPRVLAFAGFAWVAGTLLAAAVGWGPLAFSAASALPALLVIRFLIGAGEAPMFPSAANAVSCWIPAAQQGRANGFVVAGIGLGSAIAPPLLSAIMVRWNWRAALLASALPALATGLAWLIVRTPSGAAPPTAPLRSSGKSSLGSRSFALLTASYTCQGYVGYIFVFWFYLYLVEERHFDILRGAWWSSLPWLLSLISIPAGGFISDRLARCLGFTWGRRLVPLAGLIGSGIFLAYGASTSSPVGAAIALALATALVLSVEGPFWATMMEIAGARSGFGGGVMNMGCNAGGLISPALTPALAAMVGWEKALWVAAALAAAGGLLWFGISPRPDGPDAVARPGAARE